MSACADIIASICSAECSDAEAAEQFRELHAREPASDFQLLAHVRSQCPEWTRRALTVLSKVSVNQRIAPVLLPLLSSTDDHVRTQAALLLARARPNAAWVSTMLEDEDPRVRANVVEGIRGFCRDVGLIEIALQDKTPRVRANALLLLYDLRPQEALQRLETMLASDEWRDRSSACWACGATEDAAAIPLVQRMRNDEHSNVRWNALRALASLHRAMQSRYAFI